MKPTRTLEQSPATRVVELDRVRLVIPHDQAEAIDQVLVAWLLELLEATPE